MNRRWLVTFLVGLILPPGDLSAQSNEAAVPAKGDFVVSMGQPSWVHPYGGLSAGGYFGDDASDFAAYASAGIWKDLVSPVAAAAAVQLEGYAGVRGGEADGGLRGLFTIPFLRLGFGVDWSFKDGSVPFLMRLTIPFRRGGVIARGGQFTVDWLPARGNSFNVGFNVPIGQKWAGKSRPNRIRYPVGPDRPSLPRLEETDPLLEPVLANVRETSYWVNRLTVPYFDQTGRRRDQAVAAFTDYVQGIAARLSASDPLFGGAHGSSAELAAYHAEVTRAFSIALSGEAIAYGQVTPDGERVAAAARAILLEEVLFPYDRLLGVYKNPDTTDDLAFTAMERLEAWLRESGFVPSDRLSAVKSVFRTVLEEVEAARAQSREWWGDDRLVWLPLQYGLLPDEHDTQLEMDAIIERATEHAVTEGNSASYAQGTQFQWDLYEGIRRAEDYHVLWIHDFTGLNSQGEADLISFYMTANYVETLTRRVEAFDATGRMPTWFIFIDQHYYEIKGARMWMNVLESPMDRRLDVPEGSEWMADSLAILQARLREAVAASAGLQAGAERYGDDWLRNRVKIQINVTNPADLSYWGNSYVPLATWPDNVIRDHRKIAFYDLTEEDPYRGRAIFSGMGVAEHYVGPNWEDRALVLIGPAALEVKSQARALLISQGFEETEIPEPLRPKPFAEDYWERVDEFAARNLGGARAVQVHNGTGYLFKYINVLKAVLYTLMPPGAVIIDPDSLNHNPLWASMLLGSSLRGVRVIIIHPSQKNAPGQAFMTLSRASEMFERMIIANQVLGGELERAGGLFKPGLYDVDVDVGNLPARVRLVAEGYRAKPWIQEILPWSPELLEAYQDIDEIYAEATGGQPVEYLADELEGVRRPMLHLKTNFFASEDALRFFLASPAFAEFTREYMAQRSLDNVMRQDYRDIRETGLAVGERFRDLVVQLREANPEEYRRGMGYFLVGSSNQDYRSMLMDGEVGVALSGLAAINGLWDSMGLAAGATYPETVEELDEYLPYYTGFKWKVSRWIKVAL